MPRTTNINGMRAIVLHNVLKQMKRLTKDNKKLIVDFISTLNIDELKQKGLTKQIISKFKDGKPRNVLTGGMKRGREDDEDNSKHIKRPIYKKIVGIFQGEPLDDEEYTIKKKREEIVLLAKEIQRAEEEHEIAKKKLKDAQEQERLAQTHVQVLQDKKQYLFEEYQQYIKNDSLARKLKDENLRLRHKLDIEREKTSALNNDAIKELLENIKVNDTIYFNLTKEHLPEVLNIMSYHHVPYGSSSIDTSPAAIAQAIRALSQPEVPPVIPPLASPQIPQPAPAAASSSASSSSSSIASSSNASPPQQAIQRPSLAKSAQDLLLQLSKK